MTDQLDSPGQHILPVGTQVVTLAPVLGPAGQTVHPRGAVGVVAQSPLDQHHAYRVRFSDDFETALRRKEFVLLTSYQRGQLNKPANIPANIPSNILAEYNLFDRVIYRCVVGSRAYGLEHEGSDTDRRGIYLPPAGLHWSLFGVPEQLENDPTQECYWELQKFVMLALKANPNVLECLYSPLVEHATPLAQELLAMRSAFLSRLVYQTYNGYVMSQFRKIKADLRNRGEVKWKHLMHLIRLLLAGIHILREGVVPVRVEDRREDLLAIRNGEATWDEMDAWRLELHRQFDDALANTRLPERPDYEQANAFLVKSRRAALAEELP